MKANHKKYFDCHPDVNVFHFTTDGLAFREKGKAASHQKDLTGKPEQVETVKRGEKVEKPEPSKEEKLKTLNEELDKLNTALADAKDKKEKEELEEKIVKVEVEIENLK